MRTRMMVVIMLACMGLGAAGTALAQGGKPNVQSADITSDKCVYKWKDRTFEFTGNVRVEVLGPDHAVMTAPKMVGKAAGNNQITELTATGPVKFDITTAKDDQGVQRIISAASAGGAVYHGGSKLITMIGGAEAVMTTNPADPDVEPAKFTATTLNISLQDFAMSGEGFHAVMQFVPGETKKPQ